METKILFAMLLLCGFLAAYGISSSDFEIFNFNQGFAGANASTGEYGFRMTATSQPSTANSQGGEFYFNLGWYNATEQINLTPANITAVFGANISKVYFLPTAKNSTNVSAFRQTQSNPLFNVTNSGTTCANIVMKSTPNITGFMPFCSKYYNQTGRVNLTDSFQTIMTLCYGSNGIWCWADYNVSVISKPFNFDVE